MYHVTSFVKRPKRKIAVTVVACDGEIFDGHFFISGDQRIKDLLNGDSQFVPFETLGGAIHILNRDAIARVIERQEMTEPLPVPRIRETSAAGPADYLKN